MTASNRGAKSRNAMRSVRSHGAQPEDIGNKRTFDDMRIPPDDMGNKADEGDVILAQVHDGIGNSLDEMPAHLNSGILSQLAKKTSKPSPRRRSPMAARENIRREPHSARQAQGEPLESMNEKIADLFSSEDYMKNLIAEFGELLKNKHGQPFSFFMKESSSGANADMADGETLESFKDLVKNVLAANQVSAQVEIAQYRSPKHRVAVFFLSPTETDPLKNKELISALRKALSHSVKHILSSGLNVFLALANAQGVIEEHLASLGAKRGA